MTLGDFLSKGRSQKKSGEARRRSVEIDDVRNSNSNKMSMGRKENGPHSGFWLKSGPSWIKMRLYSGVGRLIARKGSLPLEYRARLGTRRSDLSGGGSDTLYASIVRRGCSRMDGMGMGDGRGQGFFPGGNGGFPGTGVGQVPGQG